MRHRKVPTRMALPQLIAKTAAVVASAVTLVGLGLAGPANAAPAAEPQQASKITVIGGPTRGAEQDLVIPQGACSNNWICFYPQTGYGGQQCQYSETTWDAHLYCSWRLNNPRSVHNYTSYRVHYYRSPDCSSGRIGSTTEGNSGNLNGGYQIKCLRFE